MTTFTSKRSQKLRKNLDCNVVSLVIDSYDASTSLLTNSDEEHIVFMADTTSSAGTQSGK